MLLARNQWVLTLAAHLGIDDHDPRRVSAAIEHVLTGVLETNDTMITSTGARSAAERLLSFSVGAAAIEACVASGGALKLADRLQPFGACNRRSNTRPR